ncbi:hypothetical protein FGB62_128g027 [Gracilaria domingensis]|nr:hypothetical protein FGB62_128g027 [Gracilaria domingensis]
MERRRHRCCRPGVNMKAPRTSPHTNTMMSSKRVPKHENTSSTTRSSQRCKVPDRIPNPTPPPLAKDQEDMIYRKWIKPNLKHLLAEAARDLGIEKLEYSWKPTKCVQILHEAFKDEGVRRFPCFANVSNAVFKQLYATLEEYAAQGRICVEYRTSLHKIRRQFIPGSAHRNPWHEDVEDIIPSVMRHIGGIRAQIPDSDEYWDIISEASKFDRKSSELQHYISNMKEKIPDLKGQFMAGRILGACLDSKSRSKLAAACRRDEDFESDKEYRIQQFHQFDDWLLAKWSLSHSIWTRLGLPSHSEKPRSFLASPENKCHGFWQSRFLFAGKLNEFERKFKGVALDTVLAIIWNADMTLKDTEQDADAGCLESHWRCKLSSVTEKRWKLYVEPHKKSLSAFDDDNKCRFKPNAPIHLDCSACYAVLDKGSVLLRSLHWIGGE